MELNRDSKQSPRLADLLRVQIIYLLQAVMFSSDQFGQPYLTVLMRISVWVYICMRDAEIYIFELA